MLLFARALTRGTVNKMGHKELKSFRKQIPKLVSLNRDDRKKLRPHRIFCPQKRGH